MTMKREIFLLLYIYIYICKVLKFISILYILRLYFDLHIIEFEIYIKI